LHKLQLIILNSFVKFCLGLFYQLLRVMFFNVTSQAIGTVLNVIVGMYFCDVPIDRYRM